jgi:hypothetical protein
MRQRKRDLRNWIFCYREYASIAPCFVISFPCPCTIERSFLAVLQTAIISLILPRALPWVVAIPAR